MITLRPSEKTLAFLLLAVAVLISIIHLWYPLTISPPHVSERTGVPVTMTIFAAMTVYGYRWGRVGIGFTYAFMASVNLLIILAYFSTMNFNQLAQIGLSTLILGSTGIMLLKWKGIRIFEEEREKSRLTIT